MNCHDSPRRISSWINKYKNIGFSHNQLSGLAKAHYSPFTQSNDLKVVAMH